MVIVRKRKERRSRGAAAVEAALVMPILLLVTFGAIKYGWLFLKAQQITNAARYGARVAIRADASTQNVLDTVAALLGPNGAKIIAADETPPVTFKVNGAICSDISSADEMGDAITVTITIPSANIDIMNVPLFPDVGDIGASVTMAKEGI